MKKSNINTAVSDLRSGLSNNKIQYKDKETGQIINTTSSSTRRALERQLDQAILRQTEINTKVDALNEQLFEYETEIVEVKTGNDIAGELGPLKYLSGLTGIPMDRIINYLLLTIIFVFDPLAIALVIAANFAFEKLRPKIKDNIYGEKVVIEDDEFWTEEEIEDFNEQFNADDLLPDEDDKKEQDNLTPDESQAFKVNGYPVIFDAANNEYYYLEDGERKIYNPNLPQEKDPNELVLVEKPHRYMGIKKHTIVVPRNEVPKGYIIKKDNDDLKITY